MQYVQTHGAKQYAKAYMKQFGSELTLQDVEQMKHAIAFCRQHHNFMSLVSLLDSQLEHRHTILDEMIQHFALPASMANLFDVMTRHKKLVMFAAVLQDICCLYLDMHDYLEVTIRSATALQPDQQADFEQFFTKLSGKKIISRTVVDASLIAGVRMESDLFLWQYSIASRIDLLSEHIKLKK